MTRPTEPGGAAGRAEGGFTLLEVLVVVLLLGLVLGVAVGRGPLRSPTVDLRAAAGELARALRGARTRAIAANRPVVVRLDAANRAWGIEGEAVRRWPGSFTVSLVSVAGLSGVSFAPDGSSSGGRVGLAEAGRRVEVDVAWLTGRVTVSPIGTGDAP